jgi:N-acetyl sugar amidotransferase
MDTSDPEIEFDDAGRCSHCRRAERLLGLVPKSAADAESRLERIAADVKARGKGAEYDCLVGLSGGVDSSYVAWLAGQLGLRVLAVHFDNGWNSEIAVANIRSICETLDFELMTYVINWEEFRDLQRSFLYASVVDVELVTDHAIFAAMARLARDHRIKIVLSGTNVATEAILPQAWVWPKQDLRNIRGIHKRFGTVELETFPVMGLGRWALMRYSPFGLRYVELLNNAQYRKGDAMKTLEADLSWRYYGGKHYESVFTKFYQAFILPHKFGIDKRRAHLSSLIMNGEITRDEALAELAEPLYVPDELKADRSYVLKKLGFSDDEFEAIMRSPVKAHDDYPSSAVVLKGLGRFRERLKERSLRSG